MLGADEHQQEDCQTIFASTLGLRKSGVALFRESTCNPAITCQPGRLRGKKGIDYLRVRDCRLHVHGRFVARIDLGWFEQLRKNGA
jgi:hypothetical protein